MPDPAITEVVLQQGNALVRAIEALGVIEPSGWFEGTIPGCFKRRLRAVVKVALAWVTEEILSASEHIGGDRAAVWMSKN